MIQGITAPGFEAVHAAFEANFSKGLECGAALCVWRGDDLLIDIWGGHTDRAKTTPWEQDTLVNVWSSTKGIVATAIAILVDQGALCYSDRVSDHWPEFAQAGKADITVAQLMSHQTGLNAWRAPLQANDLFDWEKLTDLIAAQEPWWQPGSQSGYQAMTFGFMAGELIRRASGLWPSQFIAYEIAKPLGLENDLFIGLPEDEAARAATIIKPRALPAAPNQPPPTDVIATFNNPPINGRLANSAEWRAAELPAANGHTNARALAKLYACLASGGEPIMAPSTLADTLQIRTKGPERVLPFPVHWAAGFITSPDGLYGPNLNSFGHSGRGGSFGFADPDRQLGVSYVMNQMSERLAGDPRTVPIIASLYKALDDAP